MSWLLYLIVLVVGGFGGYVLARARNPDTRVRELEEHLRSLQARFDSYQESVTQHFVTTAQLANAVTQGYREMHEHLQHGAQTLCADNRRHGSDNPAQAFERLDTPRALQGSLNDDTYALEPPRDYATKKPLERGTLDEGFGFRE
ncbi:MAG: hypothetical protein K0Q68_3139 [Moraxellaceae bacterium]|jgi:uncharacterized membrane-anchored protein YhcB (DUF1043 family)|nr:hypothetical protein [Moraxellaceae bacterium]